MNYFSHMKNAVPWELVEAHLEKNPAYMKALKKTELEYALAREIISARLRKNMTQKDVAIAMDTKQSVISRVENANTVPSLSFLKRLAVVLDAKLHVELTI